ncbi:hypothetical protein HPB48_003846 [Haemaphysalis longicornis]|uniref:Uncharacterized protein n=1 Tax=Haemaphysalis longicornis TaxID=44386 RepID=A0A9J6FJJ9_HAELO|nr:hypothetical protein HPB48_003846 [Haemaphysalis longicornis]
MFVATAQAVATGSESHHAPNPRTYVVATTRESPTTPGVGSATTDTSNRAAANALPAAADTTADDHGARADDASHRTDTSAKSSADAASQPQDAQAQHLSHQHGTWRGPTRLLIVAPTSCSGIAVFFGDV